MYNCRRPIPPADAPVILVLGMCGGRPMPVLDIRWLCAWIISTRNLKTIGTIGLSREAFLEGILLKRLMFINKRTTIVPNTASVINGVWKFELSPWSSHSMLADADCAWKLASADNGKLVYGWEHHTAWSHEHEETTHDNHNGEYALSCKLISWMILLRLSDIYSGRTKNYVEIPTQYTHKALEITIRGESSIRISGKTNHKKWKKKTMATWSASIIAEAGPSGSGMRFRVSGGSQPVIKQVEAEGECVWDLVQLHGNYLPKTVDINAVVNALRETLEGTWKYACPGSTTYALINPVFTVTGHLVASLVPQSSAGPAFIATATEATMSTFVEKSTTVQVSNSLLTTSSTTALLAVSNSGSDEESPLPTPALEMPSLRIEPAPMAKTMEYTATEMKVELDHSEFVDPYDAAF